jgi:predicted ATPase
MGEPLTAATRLARIASPGDVLFDAQTYRRLRDDVVVQADDDAFRFVDFAAPDAGRSRPFRAPMVGRERELRRLQDAFAQAVGDRSCHLFTVLGSAGVGKSRLLDEFLAQLGEERVCRGRCLPYGEGITYWPVLEAVREAVGIVDADSPGEAAAKLAATLAGEHDATLVAGRVAEVIGLSEAALSAEDGFAAVRTLLEAVARRQPLVVLFDDVHWGEPNFLDLIEHLADWTRDVPLLLVCLARPELLDLRPGWGGGKLNATSILLEPLSDDESGRLVAFLDGQALDSETRRRIVEAAEGNPLFVEEMLSLALEGGGDEALAVPPTIQALLAARLDRLGDAERSVIEAAAVAGKVFYEDAVVELVPEVRGDVAAALGLLVRKELIRPERAGIGGRTYRFRHILIRDAAYESISKSARAELHERFGRWLERMASDRLAEYEEVVGYHVEQACLYVRELGGDETRAHALAAEAAARLGTAGRRAFVRSDAPGGVNLISRAVALLPADDPQRVELVPNVRVVQGLRGDLVWAERVLTEAVEAAAVSGDRRLAANALVQRAFLRLFTGADVTPDELLETARRAIVVFADLDDDLGLARAWRLTAQAHYLARRAEACGDASERALGYARRAEDVFEQREILEWLAIALFLGPLPADEAVQRCEQLLELTRGDLVSEVHILGAQAFLLAMQARVEEAHRLIARGERLMQELGEWIWIYTWHAAAIDLWHGAAEAAEERIRPAYEALKKLGEQSHFSTMAHGLGTALYLQGRYDEAEQLTHECEAAARANDVYSGVIWRSTRAKVLARKGDFEAAERLAAEAVLFAAQGDFHLASAEASMDLATVHEIAGRPRAAADAVEAAMRFYELKGNVLGLDSARARLADLRPVTPDSVPFTPA